MGSLIERAVAAYRVGGVGEVGMRAARFCRRRFHRIGAKLRRMRADVEILNPPGEVICLDPVDLRVRVWNRSRVVWKSGGGVRQRCSLGARFIAENGTIVESAHEPLPGRLAPGASCEV